MKKILSIFFSMLVIFSGITLSVHATLLSNPIYDNNPPTPPVITGPSSGKVREPYTYYITVSDPDDDLLIKVEMNFGDGITSCGGCDGRGPWESGAIVDFEHIWTKIGNFSVRGRVSDEHGVWSEWSDPLPVTMPYVIIPLWQQFVDWLFQRFPTAFPLLRQLMEN